MATTIIPPTLAVNDIEVKTPTTPTPTLTPTMKMMIDEIDKSSVDQPPLHLIIDDAIPAQQRNGTDGPGLASVAPNELPGSPKMTNGHTDETSKATKLLTNGELSPKSGSRSEPRFVLPNSSSVIVVLQSAFRGLCFKIEAQGSIL